MHNNEACRVEQYVQVYAIMSRVGGGEEEEEMSVSKKPILEKALSVQAPPCVSFRDDVPDPIYRGGGGGATRQFSAVSRTYSDVTGGPSARDARQYRRTKTVSGDSAASALSAQHAFRRAISRQYTLNTGISHVSSVAEEEWRPIFDKVYLL